MKTHTHIQLAFANEPVGTFKTIAEIGRERTPVFPNSDRRPGLSAIAVCLNGVEHDLKPISGIEFARHPETGARGARKVSHEVWDVIQYQSLLAVSRFHFPPDDIEGAPDHELLFNLLVQVAKAYTRAVANDEGHTFENLEYLPRRSYIWCSLAGLSENLDMWNEDIQS
jgi:hypothetical protein